MVRDTKSTPPAGQAVVIGGGISGMTAAQTLRRYFGRVTVVERDDEPAGSAFRPGTPQSRHAHTLMPRAQVMLEGVFPGLMAELLAVGAVRVENNEIALFDRGVWRRPHSGKPEISFSRPLLESTLYQRLAGQPGMTFLHGYQTLGLESDPGRQHIKGVQVHDHSGHSGMLDLPADLVLDTSGRQSRAPEWLAALGFEPPQEWRVNAHVGYTSQIFKIPARFSEVWKKLYVRPVPPSCTRGGIILPLEGGRWHVTLLGVMRDYPPVDEAGFMNFARSLPTPRFYDAIRRAEPLSRPAGFQLTENRLRRYDRLPRYLEGFLVSGDAAYALNPVYAQGMTAALLVAGVLETTLVRSGNRPQQPGLARHFQQALAKEVGRLWEVSTSNDWDWPGTEIDDNESPLPKRPVRTRPAYACSY